MAAPIVNVRVLFNFQIPRIRLATRVADEIHTHEVIADHRLQHQCADFITQQNLAGIKALAFRNRHNAPLSPVTSSTKPEVRNLLQRRQRTEPLPKSTCIQNSVSLAVVVFELCEQTDNQTYSSQHFGTTSVNAM